MNEAMSIKAPGPAPRSATDGVAARPLATVVLREHADRLRRDAGRMHAEADRLEALASQVHDIFGPAEQALFDMAIHYSSPF